MKNYLSRLALGVFLAMAVCGSPVFGQYIYLADYANNCMVQPPVQPPGPTFIYHVFVDYPGVPDVVAVSFRLGTEALGPEDVLSATPASGVEIVSGDLFGGITLSLSESNLGDFAALSLECISNPPYQRGDEWVHDPKIIRASGDTISLDEAWAMFGLADCFELHVCWQCPDTADAYIGADSQVRFRVVMTPLGVWGCDVTITDDHGWVTGITPSSIWGQYCGFCAWDSGFNTVSISVPEGVEEYEHSKVTIAAPDANSSVSFYIRAVPPIGVRESSWGSIKKLFKGR